MCPPLFGLCLTEVPNELSKVLSKFVDLNLSSNLKLFVLTKPGVTSCQRDEMYRLEGPSVFPASALSSIESAIHCGEK